MCNEVDLTSRCTSPSECHPLQENSEGRMLQLTFKVVGVEAEAPLMSLAFQTELTNRCALESGW